MQATVTLVLAIALLPQQTARQSPGINKLMLWSVLSGASIMPGIVWQAGEAAVHALPMASGIALLVFVFGSLNRTLTFHLGDRRTASRTSLATLLLSLSLPLWAAPIAVINGTSRCIIDTIVALCPVTYLATLNGTDYLRGDWLYRYTPYGSLRFDYPDPVHATVTLVVVASALTAFTRYHLPRGGTGRPLALSPKALEIKP